MVGLGVGAGYFVIVEGFHFEELVAVAIAVFNL